MTSTSKPIVLNVHEWDPSNIIYSPPKVSDKGFRSVNIISKQTNRSLHISTPLMMTWGISDYVDEKGDSDGKFSISLNFPNEEYRNKQTDEFLDKLKVFESKILDDAVKNSELWFGQEMSKEVVKHMFFPILKYSKNKETKKIDLSKPPAIRAKVQYLNNNWSVEIYDTKSNMIYPDKTNELITPVDLVPKMSQVACVLQATGIYIVGGKSFGVTWKMIQCVVKPREIVSVYGRCHIQLSEDEREQIESQKIADDTEIVAAVVQNAPVVPAAEAVAALTMVEDSDEEGDVEEPVVPPPVPEPATAPIFKKVVKKPTASVATEQPVEESSAVDVEAPKKKVVKKKVVA